VDRPKSINVARLVYSVVALFFFGSFAFPQSTPRKELNLGYGILMLPDKGSQVEWSPSHGWTAAVAIRSRPSPYYGLGLVVEGSGSYGGERSEYLKSATQDYLYTIMGGPRLYFPQKDRFMPFAHFLVGYGKGSATLRDGSDHNGSGPAFAVSGGLDINIQSRYSLRVAQFDYLYLMGGSVFNHHFRYSAGIVAMF
jgi:hypothetical protein